MTIANALLTFVLTGVLGTWITYFWQRRNWRHQQDYTRNRELLSQQIKIVEDLSDLIGRRRFRMLRAIASLRSANKDRIEVAWKSYDEVVILWNDNVNSYITKLRQFFRKRLQHDLDIYITTEFQRIGGMLEHSKRMYDGGKTNHEYFETLQRARIDIDLFGGQTNEYIGRLWKHIDGLKNDMDGRPEISFSNESRLSRWYLLKHIFQPRVQL